MSCKKLHVEGLLTRRCRRRIRHRLTNRCPRNCRCCPCRSVRCEDRRRLATRGRDPRGRYRRRHALPHLRGANEALRRQATYLGMGLGIITSALSPEVILLTGGLTSSWARFGEQVESELARQMLAGSPPPIVVTNNLELARLRGAAALALQHH